MMRRRRPLTPLPSSAVEVNNHTEKPFMVNQKTQEAQLVTQMYSPIILIVISS